MTPTAPEYVVLLARGRSPLDGPVVRAALVECVVRGLLRIERRSVRGVLRPRTEWHLVPGSGTAPVTLAPIVAAVDAAPEVVDLEGRPGRTVAAVVKALKPASEGHSYADRHVLPALAAAGLVSDVSPPRWFRTGRFTLTAAGAATASDAEARVVAARAAVKAIPARGSADATREARLAAAAALGAAGVLVIAEKDLLAAASTIRRALAEDGSSADAALLLYASGADGSSSDGSSSDGSASADDAARIGELFDAVDAGAFDAADGGAGGDGGDGGGGGGD